MADYATQRFNMVETQVRTNDVTDPRIAAAMMAVARETLVPAARPPTAHGLDVACGTGYSAVVLGKIVKSVVALEQDADLVRIASDMIPASGGANVTVVQGGLTEGVRAKAPFDAILINGAVEAVPDS